MSNNKRTKWLTDSDYTALAEFRYQIRRYMRHLEQRARQTGHNPQQYQLLLAIKGLPKGLVPTISAMAERMQLNHNSMVELVDRCQRRSLLRRTRSVPDLRQVVLELTPDGQELMRRYAKAARHELDIVGPMLAKSIGRLLDSRRSAKHNSTPQRRTRD